MSLSAFGRKLPFNLGGLRASERPVLVRVDIRPGRVFAFRPKSVIDLERV
jgi:hypothetical protein